METAQDILQRRVSVRDLASKFERSRSAAVASRVAKETKVVETEQVSGEAEFQKLKRILSDLKTRQTGRNKADVERALSVTDALEEKYTKRGAELTQGRAKLKQLMLLFNEITHDAKSMLADARSVARAEIGAAQETVTMIQNVLQEHDINISAASMDTRELEELKREAHEARRIRMLHQSSKAMDMEQQITSLRQQLQEKAAETLSLRKEAEVLKEQGRGLGTSLSYLLAGGERLGATLSIVPVGDSAIDLSRCTVQWYQVKDGMATDLISGAIRPQYAPEPLDVGRMLRAEIYGPGGKTLAVQTSGPIEPSRGLEEYVDTLASKGGAQFNVRIVLKNGESVEKQSLHTFDVNKTRLKLFKGHSVKAKEAYSASMQLCGARGGGDSAAQGLFWVAKKERTFMLVLESVRERNAAIMLSRLFARRLNIELGGPGDIIQLEA